MKMLNGIASIRKAAFLNEWKRSEDIKVKIVCRFLALLSEIPIASNLVALVLSVSFSAFAAFKLFVQC